MSEPPRSEQGVPGAWQEQVKRTHVLERTSPMGELFVGTCRLCGESGLRMAQANDYCKNPSLVSETHALLDAIEGPDD